MSSYTTEDAQAAYVEELLCPTPPGSRVLYRDGDEVSEGTVMPAGSADPPGWVFVKFDNPQLMNRYVAPHTLTHLPGVMSHGKLHRR